MNENERLKAARKSFKLSQTEFGDRIGLSRDVISNLEQGRVEIKDYMRKLISGYYNISEAWLESGEGDMLVPLTKDEEFLQVITEIQVSDDEFIKRLLRAYWNLEDNEKKIIRKMIDELADK